MASSIVGRLAGVVQNVTTTGPGGKQHLLCTLPFPEPTARVEALKQKYPGLRVTYRNLGTVKWTSDQVEDDLYKDVTILCTLAALPPRSELMPEAAFVQIISAGTNHLEGSPVYQDPKITFTNSSGIHAPTIAEWVIMMMLVSNRNYNELHDAQKEHKWGGGQNQGSAFTKLSDNLGKRVAILGYGSIGRQVARIAKAMGMDVIAYTASPRDTKERRKDDGFIVPGSGGDPDGSIPSQWFSGTDKESLHKFLAQDIDYLVIGVPLTEKTKYMLGKEEFEVLGKHHTYVINIARGDVLVQDELIASLELFESSKGEQGIRGAAVDVTSPEPLPQDAKLWDAPNIIVTSHISGISKDYIGRCFQILEENVDRYMAGKRLLNVVDRARGYSSNSSD